MNPGRQSVEIGILGANDNPGMRGTRIVKLPEVSTVVREYRSRIIVRQGQYFFIADTKATQSSFLERQHIMAQAA